MKDTTKYLKNYKKPDYLIKTVDLEFELSDHHTLVRSKLVLENNNKNNMPLVMDGEGLKLNSVSLNEKQLTEQDYVHSELGLTINYSDELVNEFTLDIVTEIDPANNKSLEGLYKSDGAFCTQCEAEGFRKITYFIDRPDVLAIYTTKIIADKSLYPQLLANGNKVDCGELEGNRHWVKWHDPFKKPCYLFALVAGDLDVLQSQYLTKSGREVALEIYVDKGNVNKAEHAMQSLKKAMKWDEDVYNLEYDLDIYMIVAVDFFNMGAMENKGLNIFNSKYVLANEESAVDLDFDGVEAVIAHEYFHNWSGNRVTCRDWFQLSLKEGFTVFRDQEFSSDMGSRNVCRIGQAIDIKTVQFEEDASPMSHPIRPEAVKEMNNFYTVTVYEKGAEVIRMLYKIVGGENFHKGATLYFERFDGQAVTCDDFVDCMEEISDQDLTLFRRWYSQSGTPEVSVTTRLEDGLLKLNLSQFTPSTKDQANKQALHIPIDLAVYDEHGSLIVSQLVHLTEENREVSFATNAKVVTPSINRGFSAPVKVNFDYSQQQLADLFKYETDAYAKWDASQRLYLAEIELLYKGENELSPRLVESMTYLFDNLPQDSAYTSLLLSVPDYEGCC